MADYGTNYTDKELDKLEKKIKSVYKEAEKDIEKKMNDFTAKSKAKEQKNLQKVAKGEMTQAEFDKWKAGQVFQGKQWAAKKEEIANVLYDANTVASKIVNNEQFNVFAANANFASYQMEQGAGVNFGFSLYDQNTVIRLIKDEPNLLPNYVPKKSKDITWNTKKITRQITQGIIQGESLDKISKRLATVTASQNFNSMKTHARTLMTGAQNAGRLSSYEKAQKLGEIFARSTPMFVFSINYFPYISIVCQGLGIKYVSISVTCPMVEIYNTTIRNSCNRVFLFDHEQYLSVRDENPEGIFYLPLGAGVSRMDTAVGELEEERYLYDVSFVGSLYNEKDP
ncbi:MAG: hypothetical protein IJJ65_10720, partial [Butyrivibrio sp.]|nr:hypothetical protein [Butyrivibrio sp.]